MMNPERAFAHKYEQHEKPLSADEEQVWNAYVPNWRSAEPTLDSFNDVYSDIEIKQAKQFVRERQEKEQDKHERAQLFEALLFDALEQELWLGENAYLARTSEFDDRVNGTDLVVEFRREGQEPARLAVDVTVTANIDTVRYKVQQIREKLERGQLTALKYFESSLEKEEGGVKGSVQDLPRVIIGVSPESLQQIIRPFTVVRGEDKKAAKKARRQIEQHPLQRQILQEITAQLAVQKKAVARLAPDRSKKDMLSAIEQAAAEVEKVMAEKQNLPQRVALREDRTMRFLTSELAEPWGVVGDASDLEAPRA